MKRVISTAMVIMVSMLLALPGVKVSADENSTQKAISDAISKDSTQLISANEQTELVPDVIKTEKDFTAIDSYYKVTFSESTKELVMPIKIPAKGCLQLALGEFTTNYRDLVVSVYSDSSCTNKIGYSVYLFSGDIYEEKSIVFQEGGTYYLKYELLKVSEADVLDFALGLCFFSNEDMELTEEQVVFSYSDSDIPEVTYKIKVNSTGYIAVQFAAADDEYGFSSKFQLLDKNKKELSKEAYVSADRNDEGGYNDIVQYYAVNKGTYYVKVKSIYGLYAIAYDFTSVKDKAGSSKSKATSLKLGGSAVKGICTVSDKTSKEDWYKFTLTKNKSIKITINTKIDGNLKVEIMDSSGKTVWYGTRTLYEGEYKLEMKSSGKWSKGTYYIKVTKPDKTSSGYYTVKVK